nr:C586 [uncultured bacterium]
MIEVSLDKVSDLVQQQSANVLALDEALTRLAQNDARQSEIVVLRFFGGLSIEETAEVLRVSPGTIMRDWTFARAWLRNEMNTSI